MSFLSLPNEILLAVASNLSPQDQEDLRSLLSFRGSCRRVCDVVTLLLHGKLGVRVGVSIDNAIYRMRSCPQHRNNSAFLGCFSTVAFDWTVLRPPNQPNMLFESLEHLAANTVNFLYAAVSFLRRIGPHLVAIHITSGAGHITPGPVGNSIRKCYNDGTPYYWNELGRCYSYCNSAHAFQDRFFKAISIALLYTSSRGFLRNVHHVDIRSGCGHYVSHFSSSIFDSKLESRLDRALQVDSRGEPTRLDRVLDGILAIGSSVPEYLLKTYIRDHDPSINLQQPSNDGWKSRKPIPLFQQLKSLHIQNRMDPLWDFYDYSYSDPRPQHFDTLIRCTPRLRSLTYDAVQAHRCFDMEPLPAFSIKSFVALNFGKVLPPAIVFQNVKDTLVSLELIDCQLWHQEWYQLRDGYIDTSHSFTIDRFLDALLVALPQLERLKVEGLGYNWNHYEQLIRQGRPIEPWKQNLAIIPDAPFRRPVVTPFRKDIDALIRLRDQYTTRRKVKGLSVDDWSHFLVKFEAEIVRLFSADDLRDP